MVPLDWTPGDSDKPSQLEDELSKVQPDLLSVSLSGNGQIHSKPALELQEASFVLPKISLDHLDVSAKAHTPLQIAVASTFSAQTPPSDVTPTIASTANKTDSIALSTTSPEPVRLTSQIAVASTFSAQTPPSDVTPTIASTANKTDSIALSATSPEPVRLTSQIAVASTFSAQTPPSDVMPTIASTANKTDSIALSATSPEPVRLTSQIAVASTFSAQTPSSDVTPTIASTANKTDSIALSATSPEPVRLTSQIAVASTFSAQTPPSDVTPTIASTANKTDSIALSATSPEPVRLTSQIAVASTFSAQTPSSDGSIKTANVQVATNDTKQLSNPQLAMNAMAQAAAAGSRSYGDAAAPKAPSTPGSAADNVSQPAVTVAANAASAGTATTDATPAGTVPAGNIIPSSPLSGATVASEAAQLRTGSQAAPGTATAPEAAQLQAGSQAAQLQIGPQVAPGTATVSESAQLQTGSQVAPGTATASEAAQLQAGTQVAQGTTGGAGNPMNVGSSAYMANAGNQTDTSNPTRITSAGNQQTGASNPSTDAVGPGTTTRSAAGPSEILTALQSAAMSGTTMNPNKLAYATSAAGTSGFVDGTASASKTGLSPLQVPGAEMSYKQAAEALREQRQGAQGPNTATPADAAGLKQVVAGIDTSTAADMHRHGMHGHLTGQPGTPGSPTTTDVHGTVIPSGTDAQTSIGSAGHGKGLAGTPADIHSGQTAGAPAGATGNVDGRLIQTPGQAVAGSTIGDQRVSPIGGTPGDAHVGQPSTAGGAIPGVVGPGGTQPGLSGDHDGNGHALHVPNLNLDDNPAHGPKGKLHDVDQSDADAGGGIDLGGLGAAAGAGAGLASLLHMAEGMKGKTDQQGNNTAPGSGPNDRKGYKVTAGDTLYEISKKFFMQEDIAIAPTLIVQINHKLLKPRTQQQLVVITLRVGIKIQIPSQVEFVEFKKQVATGTQALMNITYDSESAHTVRPITTDPLGGHRECQVCGHTTYKGNLCPECGAKTY